MSKIDVDGEIEWLQKKHEKEVRERLFGPQRNQDNEGPDVFRELELQRENKVRIELGLRPRNKELRE